MNALELFPEYDYENPGELSNMINVRTFDCVFVVNQVHYRGWWSVSFLKFIVAEKHSMQFEPNQVSQYKRIDTPYNRANGEY